MRMLLIMVLLLPLGMLSLGQKSTSFGFGLTATDKCATLRYGFMFYDKTGRLSDLLNGNGIYFTAGKGQYPNWNILGAKDHLKVSGGIMIGSYWQEQGWWPTINVGISRHWTNVFGGYQIFPNQPVFRQWDLEFGSSGQIGFYYPWVTVALFRQLEMTFGIGVTF